MHSATYLFVAVPGIFGIHTFGDFLTFISIAALTYLRTSTYKYRSYYILHATQLTSSRRTFNTGTILSRVRLKRSKTWSTTFHLCRGLTSRP